MNSPTLIPLLIYTDTNDIMFMPAEHLGISKQLPIFVL